MRPSLVIALLTCPACAPAPDQGYMSAAPEAKIDAIMITARAADTAELHLLVEQLDSDDAAVRLAAIATLQRLTGESHGFHHADPPELRAAAVDRWLQALGHAGSSERAPDV